MTRDPRLLGCVWDITVDKNEERELTALKLMKRDRSKNTVGEDETESHGTKKWRANPIKLQKLKKIFGTCCVQLCAACVRSMYCVWRP